MDLKDFVFSVDFFRLPSERITCILIISSRTIRCWLNIYHFWFLGYMSIDFINEYLFGESTVLRIEREQNVFPIQIERDRERERKKTVAMAKKPHIHKPSPKKIEIISFLFFGELKCDCCYDCSVTLRILLDKRHCFGVWCPNHNWDGIPVVDLPTCRRISHTIFVLFFFFFSFWLWFVMNYYYNGKRDSPNKKKVRSILLYFELIIFMSNLFQLMILQN